ncbi:C-GCAxxG-C-C family (seleno)protein [Robiginitalea aurantiaca]|uniref:C-GCAxxG-C-C family (Seleno)protein n=1 Tax=Robiginitalea aurantiaca TaxID=3056915 RepID=A0ABT7WDA5_9FLAO|nr:C-GCAxxG-C-C family (seleno)protein [Robiginitalea aurantiaca]MDM9630878.1 C-GCAxxG-C-C family (seleno)protein [Robiginitalea aurantiaca]
MLKECRTCSRTFATILNRQFGHPRVPEEKAMNLMAGGILNQGYQCGMLWGATLAVGAESFRRNEKAADAIAVAVLATRHVVQSFLNLTETMNCREIIGYDLTTLSGMAKFMIKTTIKGNENSRCFNLAEAWAPAAIDAATEMLEQKAETKNETKSCASEVVRQMGGSQEEMVMVAGFAGGLGLYGGACGALSAALWKNTLDWCRKNPDEDPPYFNNKTARRILKSFKAETKGKMRCNEICGQCFKDLGAHSDYLNQGGCKSLLGVLGGSVHD